MRDGKKPEATRVAAEVGGMVNEELVSQTEEIVSIPTDLIDPNPYQQRTEFSRESLQELGESIKDKGQLQPAAVRAVSVNGTTRYQLIYGERRWRACQMVGLPLRAVVRDVPIEDAEVFALIENIDRENLCFWDLMNGVANMRERLGSSDIVATAIHRGRRYVERVIKAHGDITSAPEIAEVFADQRKALDYSTALKFSAITDEIRKVRTSDNRQYRRYVQKLAREGIKGAVDGIYSKLKRDGKERKAEPDFGVKPLLRDTERQLSLQVSLSKLVPLREERLAEIKRLISEFVQKAEALAVAPQD
jgi:ParB/RepB/Spo0J family partition protein